MTPEQKLKAKRWNERVRLFAAFLNISAVGAFGLAVISPIMDHLKYGNEQVAGWEKFTVPFDGPWYAVISWQAALLALILHVCAHIVLSVLDREE